MIKSAYAKDTQVTVEQSQSKIQQLLRRYGCGEYEAGRDSKCSFVMFKIPIDESRSYTVRLEVFRPSATDKDIAFTDTGRRRKPDAIETRLDQVERQRWRVMELLAQANLESVAIGNKTIEEAFVSDIVIGDGQKLGRFMLRNIDNIMALPAPKGD